MFQHKKLYLSPRYYSYKIYSNIKKKEYTSKFKKYKKTKQNKTKQNEKQKQKGKKIQEV